jgi:hypothetical protein
MQAVQLILFVVVAGLASVLVLFVVRPRWKAGKTAEAVPRPRPGQSKDGVSARTPATPPPIPAAAAPSQMCPACGRQYPPGMRYCPSDARALVSVTPGVAVAVPAGSTQCPRCARLYESHKRYCPFDAEELVAAPNPVGDERRIPVHRVARGSAKICPHCAEHYEDDATMCGRDGAELVSVN